MAPFWRKAPLLLFRFPGLLIPIAAAVAVLTLGAASQSLFVSSAASATLDREFAQLDADSIGLEIGTYGIAARANLDAAEKAIATEAERVPGLGTPRLLLNADAITAVSDGGDVRLPLMFRTAALDNVPVVEEAEDDAGVWLAASAAEAIGVGAGDDVRLEFGGHRMTIAVAGIYRDIADVMSTATWRAPDPLPPDDPIVRYWARLGDLIVRPTPQGPAVQPPFILASRETVSEIAERLTVPTVMEWTFPYDVRNPSLERLRRSLVPLRAMEGRANDPLEPLGKALREVHLYRSAIPVHSVLPGVADRVAGTVAALSAPVRALSLAAQGLALLVVAVAAAFGAQRRAVELRLLVVQGVSTVVHGARAAVEAIVPTVIGAVAGWAAAVALVRAIGPSPELTPDVVRQALWQSLLIAALPVLVIGGVTAAVARAQAVQGSSRLRGLAARAPWEIMVLVLAGAAYFSVVSRGAPRGDEARLDGMVLLFPLLLIAGGAGLVARGLARILPKLRGSGRGRSPAMYLAGRRLSAAPSSALLLVAASSLAIGVLVYAATAASTTEENLTLKAAVNVGSDVSIELGRDPALDLPFPSTRVGQQEADVLGGAAGPVEVDVLAVDPETFARAATWSPTFSGRGLDELLAELGGEGERLPVLAVGAALPAQGTLSTSRYELPIRVTSRLRGFPGMSPDKPLVIVAMERLVSTVEAAGTSTTDERLFLDAHQWVRGDSGQIVSTLEDVAVPEDSITTIAAIRSRPDLMARSWTLGYLQAVGVVAGLLAFIGTLLYLSARQASREVAYVLARRMGLTAASHRRSVAVELAGMLALATLTGSLLAIAAAALLLPQLNPLPDLAPAPTLALPAPLLAGMVAAIVLACLIGAAVVQRSADRARVSEVLRLAA